MLGSRSVTGAGIGMSTVQANDMSPDPSREECDTGNSYSHRTSDLHTSRFDIPAPIGLTNETSLEVWAREEKRSDSLSD